MEYKLGEGALLILYCIPNAWPGKRLIEQSDEFQEEAATCESQEMK